MNYQRAIDVTGNNLANQGVIGFKSSRATFRTAFEYALQTRPSSSLGGGVSLNSIDRNMNPGTIEPTEVFTDVAIGGKGFFPMAKYIKDDDGNVIDKKYFLSRVGNFDIEGNNELVQGELRLNLLGLLSKVDEKGNIIPSKIPSAKEMIGMTNQEKIAFYDTMEPIDLSAYSVMRPLPSGELNVYGMLDSTSGPSDATFEFVSPSDEEKTYKVKLIFDKKGEDLNTLFDNEKSYSWKLDVIEWPDGEEKPEMTGEEGTLKFSRTGSVIEINGKEGNLLEFSMNGEAYKLNKDELEKNIKYSYPEYAISQKTIDAKGNTFNSQVYFEKIKTGEWAFKPDFSPDSTSKIEVVCDDGQTYTLGEEDGNLKSGMLYFGSDGLVSDMKMLNSDNEVVDISPQKYIITFNDGSTQELKINFSSNDSSLTVANNEQLSEWASTTDLKAVQKGGRLVGTLNDINFDNAGNVIANYSNGESATIARVPIIQILSPEALKVYDLYTTSFEFNPSRDIENFNGLFEAGQGGTGLMVPKALEYSNVNSAKEMTNLIMYQRLLQFNARSVQTADSILQEAVQLKR